MRVLRLALLVLSAALVPFAAAQSITIQGTPVAGSSTLYIGGDTTTATTTYTVAVYSFDPTYQPNGQTCSAMRKDGTPLTLVTGANTTALVATVGATSPYGLTLAQPLVSGSLLCVAEMSGTAIVADSAPKTVTDLTDYGRFVAIFTAGAMVNNQQQSSGSSTAGLFLDMNLVSTLVRGGLRPCTAQIVSPATAPTGCQAHTDGTGAVTFTQGKFWHPGLDLFFNARLSPISVAAKTDTTNTVPGTSSTITSTNLNLLSSQQSLRVLLGGDLPFRTRGWNKRTNAFSLAPVVSASFETLLNPSVGSGSNSVGTGTSTNISQTTANFSSVYYSWESGMRISWDRFPASTDKSPKTFAQIQATLGQYSNFSSYECVGTSKGGLVPTGATSACSSAANVTAKTTNISRVLVPRLDLSGFITFPNFPLTLGFDANLAQYGLPGTPNNIDYLNKPGNDVRIFVGYTVDLATVSKMLGLSN